jgi:hypothetical protein
LWLAERLKAASRAPAATGSRSLGLTGDLAAEAGTVGLDSERGIETSKGQ